MTDVYVVQRHHKVPLIYKKRNKSTCTSTQTQPTSDVHPSVPTIIKVNQIDVLKLENELGNMNETQCLRTNLESTDESCMEHEDDYVY